MVDITFSGGKIISLQKRKSSTGAGDYAVITLQGKKGEVSEVYFFLDDLSAFNEITESDNI